MTKPRPRTPLRTSKQQRGCEQTPLTRHRPPTAPPLLSAPRLYQDIIIDGASGVASGAYEVTTEGDAALDRIDALIADTSSLYSFDSDFVRNALAILDDTATTLDDALESVRDLIVAPRGVSLSSGVMSEARGARSQWWWCWCWCWY